MPCRVKNIFIVSSFLIAFFIFHIPAFSSGSSNLKVVCDRWPDTTTPQDFGITSSELMAAATDEAKAIAVWRMIQQCTDSIYDASIVAREPAYGITYMTDPAKLLNVYGVHYCDGLSRIMEVTWRQMGFRAEKYYKWGHTLSDVYYEDADGIERWHLFDLSQHWFLYTRDKSRLATPEGLIGDYSLIARPSNTPIPSAGSGYGHWGYVHAPHLEYPTHNMLINLRPGESILRKWSNDGTAYYDVFSNISGTDMEHGPYTRTFGNGILAYSPDFTSSSYEEGLYAAPVNLRSILSDGKSPNLHTITAGSPGTAIIRISSPYIIADARISGTFVRATTGDSLVISISNDDGATWSPVYTATGTGIITVNDYPISTSFDVAGGYPSGLITPFGHYDYLLKIEINTAIDVANCGIDDLTVSTITQHNIFSLPQLWPGSNNITVSGTIDSDTTLRVTYVWNDDMGNNRENVTVIESAPYTYEILTDGAVWEDVVCQSVKIEALPRIGGGNVTTTKEVAPSSVNTISPMDAFLSTSLIGTSSPSALKTVAAYLTDLNNAIAAQEGQHTDDYIVWGQATNVMNALWGLSAHGLAAASAKNDIINALKKDRSHQYTKAYACQTLYTVTGGNDTDVTGILKAVLQRDSSILWADDSNAEVSAGLWINTCGAAAAVLGLIANSDAKEGADDLENLLDEAWVQSKCGYNPWNIPRWSELRWAFVKALGKLGDSSNGTFLRSILTGPSNVDEKALAAQALGEVGDTGAVSDLLTVLQTHSYSPVGIYCIESLGKLEDPSVASHLYSYLSYNDEDYRGYAAEALGLLGNEDAIPYLQGLVSAESFPWVKDAAQESISLLSASGETPGPPATPQNLRIIQIE